MKEFWIYLAILAGSTYLIRAIPFVLLKRKITNRTARSFLYYIPFAVLAAMTLPAAVFATGNPISGLVGLLIGGIFAYRNKGLTVVAIMTSISALLTEAIVQFLF